MHSEPTSRNFATIRNTALKLREFKHLASIKRFSKKSFFGLAGECIDHLCFIHSGEVRLEFTTEDGREKGILYLGENTLVGEVLFFLQKPSRISFICTKPTIIWMFSKQDVIQTIFPQNPELVHEVMVTLANKARLLNEQMLTIALDDVAVRLCKLIHLYADRNPMGLLASTLPWSNQDTASLMGVHRASLYKAIKGLEEQGIIEKQGAKRYTVKNELLFFSLIGK